MNSEQEKLLVAGNNAALRNEFMAVIRSSHWHFLGQTSRVDPSQFAHLIVVGAALWSRPDLQVLNKLAEKLKNKNVTFFVFDIDEFGSTDGIKAFLPGGAMPNKTPVAAEYLSGELTCFVEGDAAFRWAEEV